MSKPTDMPATIEAIEAAPPPSGPEFGCIGVMRDDAELLDEVVAHAMRSRQLQAWRPSDEDFAALEAIAAATNRTLPDVLDEAVRLLRLHRKA
jgi:hypothetical protein